MIAKYIKSDLYRYTGKISFKLFLKNYLFNRGFNFSVWLRLASAKSMWAKFAYPIYYYKKKQYGIDIHITTKIGYGLYIGHDGPLVVNPSTVIGNNVNLSQFTTIGANGGHQAAEIGDNVYIGPQVCIVNQVKIGSNATIGGGQCRHQRYSKRCYRCGQLCKSVAYEPSGWISE